MIFDFNEILKLLKDTPLSDVKENQLRDVFKGGYPVVSHSSKMIDRIIKGSHTSDNTISNYANAAIHTSLLDAMLLKIYSLGGDKWQRHQSKIDSINAAKTFIDIIVEENKEVEVLTTMLRDCQLLIAKQETTIREKELRIKALENINELITE